MDQNILTCIVYVCLPFTATMNPHFLELFSSEMIALHQVSLAEINLLPLTNVDACSEDHFPVLCGRMISVGAAGVGQTLHTAIDTLTPMLQGQGVLGNQTDGVLYLINIFFKLQIVLNELYYFDFIRFVIFLEVLIVYFDIFE